MLPFAHAIEHAREKISGLTGLRFEAWPLFIIGLAFLLASFLIMPDNVSLALSLALFIAPVWLPFLLVTGGTELQLIFNQSNFIANQKYILLELKPPRNLVKTPLAMEAFLSTLHLTGGESHWWQRSQGGTRPFFSLELASFEGQVHFFIWGRSSYRRMIESQLYAQYPGIQISEAPDYTRLISATNEEWSIWGCDYFHTKDDQDALPIKTYVEYGLDKVQKEPEQVDPLANLIEFLGSMGKGEYLWLQFVIRAHKGEKYNKLNEKGKAYTWKDQAGELIKKIRAETRDVYVDEATGEERPGFPNPTKGQSEMIAAMERNVSKLGFDVGGRGVYLARPEVFQVPVIHQMIALFRPFQSEGWNGIKAGSWLMNFNDYPWEVGIDKVKNHYRHELVEAFRRRQFFYHPFYEGSTHQEKIMVMSTEELATIFHIPSMAVESPALKRVQSATGDAPRNLPV